VTFGLTRGEIILVAFIFGLIYTAGLLPKIATRLSSVRTKKGEAAAKKTDE
jgi:hypothetical protein